MQHAITRQHLPHARIRLPSFADDGEEFAVLELDAVHGDVDLRDVDFVVFAVDEVVVAGDVGAVVADVAEEGAEGAVVLKERERVQMAPVLAFSWMDMSMAMPSVGWMGPWTALAAMMVAPAVAPGVAPPGARGVAPPGTPTVAPAAPMVAPLALVEPAAPGAAPHCQAKRSTVWAAWCQRR